MKIIVDGRLAAATVIGAPIATVLALNKYKKRYVVPHEQVSGPYPGDELLEGDDVQVSMMAIDIDAPPEKVWPLINQIGQHKAGFYSFVGFERLACFRIDNTYPPQERWQDTKVGDWTFYGDQGIGHEIVIHEPGKYFVGMSDTRNPPTQDGAIAWLPHGTKEMVWTWLFYLQPLPGNRTRFIQRNNAYVEIDNKLKAGIVAGLIWGWSSGVMQTRMAELVKAVAEGRRFIDL